MKVNELITPKGFRNPHRVNGTHNRTEIDKENILRTITALHRNNRPPAAILAAIKNTFGADSLSFARSQLGNICMESIHVVPIQDDQVEALHNLLQEPISANDAQRKMINILSDDGLNDSYAYANDPEDVRDIIMHWLSMFMPSLLNSPKEDEMMGNGEGHFSPIHGLDYDAYID